MTQDELLDLFLFGQGWNNSISYFTFGDSQGLFWIKLPLRIAGKCEGVKYTRLKMVLKAHPIKGPSLEYKIREKEKGQESEGVRRKWERERRLDTQSKHPSSLPRSMRNEISDKMGRPEDLKGGSSSSTSLFFQPHDRETP